ncbi:MAG: hypothetical protein QGM47_05375, partial [Actinomycetota bacterium]|nr:hypothetical protein [Actinomycetota bacterium]
VPIKDPLPRSEFPIDLHAALPSLFDVIAATLTTGGFFATGHGERHALVAVGMDRCGSSPQNAKVVPPARSVIKRSCCRIG